MSATVQAKHKMCGALVDLLEKYPSRDEHVFMHDQLSVLLGLGASRQAAVQKQQKPIGQPKKADGVQGKSQKPAKSVKADGATVADQKNEEGQVNPRSFPMDSNLIQCIQVELTKAKRQLNAMRPRMDHGSLRKRAASVRKQLRKALATWKTPSVDGDGNSMSRYNLVSDRDLINALKSMRLVFCDAFTANTSVNVGSDLLTSFPSLKEIEDLAERLEKGGLLKNTVTHFWEDPKGVLPTTLSPGTEARVIPTNPFATLT